MAAIAELISPQEYLELERESETRNEFVDGIIYPRAISNHRHNLLTANVGYQLHGQLKSQPYLVLMCNMRIKVGKTESYFYPDIVVSPRESMHEDENCDSLLTSKVIVEIFSDSTECFDRGKKFQHYRQIESLTEYVLVAQDNYRIEHFIRQNNGQWLWSEAIDLSQAIYLSSIDCQLSLNEVYYDIEINDDTSILHGRHH